MEAFNKKDFVFSKLKYWFEENKRNFPWREGASPYAVWVSEVMLQQTQAAVVVGYFEKWMALFPSIEALASATAEEVIKAWEGLGYYARARHLHEGAQYLVEHHGGKLPTESQDLAKVKGLGHYTIGAIRSFAFHQKAAAVDGNVLRVMSRLLCHEEEINRPTVQKFIREKVEESLPDTRPWIIMEALIELGAVICTKKPQCGQCPLKEDCKAYCLGKERELPKRKERARTTFLKREVFLICHKKTFLVQKQKGKKLMAGLYEFPYCENEESIYTFYPSPLELYKKLDAVCHTFTRYKAQLFPTIWIVKERIKVEGFEWIRGNKLSEFPFSSGHRRILRQLLEEHADLTH